MQDNNQPALVRPQKQFQGEMSRQELREHLAFTSKHWHPVVVLNGMPNFLDAFERAVIREFAPAPATEEVHGA